MADLRSDTSVITLNVNSLYQLKHCNKWIFNNPIICFLQRFHSSIIKDTALLCKKKKKAIAVLTSGDIDYKAKEIASDKECCLASTKSHGFVLMSKDLMQNLTELKGING